MFGKLTTMPARIVRLAHEYFTKTGYRKQGRCGEQEGLMVDALPELLNGELILNYYSEGFFEV